VLQLTSPSTSFRTPSAWTVTLRYELSSFVRHTECLALPLLDRPKRALYVVDLIGAGRRASAPHIPLSHHAQFPCPTLRCCVRFGLPSVSPPSSLPTRRRALICKGTLHFVQQCTPAGHLFQARLIQFEGRNSATDERFCAFPSNFLSSTPAHFSVPTSFSFLNPSFHTDSRRAQPRVMPAFCVCCYRCVLFLGGRCGATSADTAGSAAGRTHVCWQRRPQEGTARRYHRALRQRHPRGEGLCRA